MKRRFFRFLAATLAFVLLVGSIPANANASTSLPMPSNYFSNAKEAYRQSKDNSIRYVYRYGSYPSSAAASYAKALRNSGFTVKDETKFCSGDITRLVYRKDHLCIKFNYNASEDEMTIILYEDGLTAAGYVPQSSGSSSKPSTSKPSTSKPSTSKPSTTKPSGKVRDVGVTENTTIRMKQGETIRLCSEYHNSASYTIYKWSVSSGGSYVKMSSGHDKCTIVANKKGTAKISFVYEYTYEGSNVLTGRSEHKHASKERTYTIIVE